MAIIRAPLLITIVLASALIVASPAARRDGRLPHISSLHPRIFVRHDAARVGRGVRVSQLRSRLGDPAYARWRRPDPPANLAGMVEKAARYLETGAPAELEPVRIHLSTHTYSQRENDVSGLLAGAEMATAYDWIYGGLAEADRRKIMSNIVTTADSSYDFLINGEPDINHNYTYMALQTVAVCGLVLYGEPAPFGDRARDYLAMAREWLEGPGKVLDTWKARKGAWAEGSHYTFHETVRTLMIALQAYRTASDTDYFARIERRYGSFVEQAGMFLIASTRPDLTFERIGDVLPSRAQAALTVPLTLEMIAAGLRDHEAAARIRSFSRALQEGYGDKAVNPSFDWGMRIFNEAHAGIEPSFRSYPLGMRMGAGTYEQIMFRNGWEPGSTQITIVAGDHYTDHQHFDKGQFLIYHRGGLTVDSGTYDVLYRPGAHWNDYACRTLAHNCVLVYDPAEVVPPGYGNDGGQRVLRGLQHHADWLAYLEHYRKEKLDTADVEAWEYDGKRGFGYARCNLSGAYSDKVKFYDRQFVYLPDAGYLVVFDRVDAARADLEKRWLLHFQEAPVIDGVTPLPGVSRFPGAGAIRVTRRGQIGLGGQTIAYDGRLLLHTLLPAERTILSVGGPGYEYFNTLTGKNYPPVIPDRAKEPREAGTWRIEVAPARPSAEDLFLNAFQIADGAATDEVETRLIGDSGGKLAGVQYMNPAKNEIVLLGRRPGANLLAGTLEYEIASTTSGRHLIVGLRPLQRVFIRINARASRTATVSAQGALSFEDGTSGPRTVLIGPVNSSYLR